MEGDFEEFVRVEQGQMPSGRLFEVTYTLQAGEDRPDTRCQEGRVEEFKSDARPEVSLPAGEKTFYSAEGDCFRHQSVCLRFLEAITNEKPQSLDSSHLEFKIVLSVYQPIQCLLVFEFRPHSCPTTEGQGHQMLRVEGICLLRLMLHPMLIQNVR